MLAAGAAAEIPANAVWIDVRTEKEYQQGHIEGAQRIPYDGIDAVAGQLKLPRDTPIYLYCGSGHRAGLARKRLQELGYSEVVNAGGLEDARKLVEKPGT